MQSEQTNELFTALAKAQAEIKPAIKDSNNPFFKSKYAALPGIWEACQAPLTKNGLSVTQTFDTIEGRDYLITTLGHTSGQWIKSKCPILCNDNKPQSYGSACTYSRRYALAAIAGVVTDEDDDGEAAMGRNGKQPVAQKPALSESQKKNIKELSKQIPDSMQDEIRAFIKKRGYDGALSIDPSFYAELVKRLEQAIQASKTEGEALPY